MRIPSKIMGTPISDRRAVLAGHALFGHIAPEDREKLLALGIERRFDDHQMIFQRGDAGLSMMLVLRGQVRISILSEEGKELTLAIFGPGDCFGEVALLDGQPRSADATAIGECALFVLPRKDFIPFLESHPKIAIGLLAVLCGRLRTNNDFIEKLVFQNLPTRLARLLVKLAASYGTNTPTGVRIACKLSQQEIGSLVATSRESVNKQLRAWSADGLLQMDRGIITLIKPAVFNRLADSG